MVYGPFFNSSLRRPRGRRRAMLYAQGARVLPRPNRMPLRFHHAPKSNSWLWRLGAMFLVAIGAAFALASVSTVTAAAGGVALWSSVSKNLPNVSHVGPVDGLAFATTKIYDRTGKLLTQIANPNTGYRTPVSYQEILDHIRQQQSDPKAPHQPYIFNATVAAEDSSFWTNEGVNPTAIARSFVENLAGAPISGASTITQQLVRRIYPNRIGDQESYTRKIREAIVAYEFTQHYSKPQIMQMYLNDIYYGERSYGIDAASMTYFNEHPWNLTLGEAAMLAGLPQAPSAYDPYVDYSLMKARQQYVLNQMVRQGMITQSQADNAYAEPLPIVPQGSQNQGMLAPAFVTFVEAQLEQKFGAAAVYGGGLTVKTTLDYSLQQQAQQDVASHIQQDLPTYNVDNGAMVAMLPWDGEVISMVGSADYYNTLIDGAVNVALQLRSPGSSIKPATYLTAFEHGFYPGTILNDIAKKWPIPGQPGKYYQPHNDTYQHYGQVSVRTAFDNSLNIPAVESEDWVGLQNVVNTAKALGLRTSLNNQYAGLSFTLGGDGTKLLEETNMYATLANEGRYVPYTPLLEVTNSAGKVLYKLDRSAAFAHGQQVAPAGNVYQVTNVLTDNNARAMIFGLNTALTVPEIHRPVAAKTGTSNGSRDGLTMGYTTDLAVGVWCGNTNDSPTTADGVVSAGPIWHDMMVIAHQPQYASVLNGPNGKPIPPNFPVPSTIVMTHVCNKPNLEPIIKGTEHKVVCNAGAP
ncbi:MAG TPA: transglycosylase domain-containing protein [Thermomicrobiaceae bacterium]|nr:transglycosylase domain-containing protein [Thermomicrobiaceae bacterium]